LLIFTNSNGYADLLSVGRSAYCSEYGILLFLQFNRVLGLQLYFTNVLAGEEGGKTFFYLQKLY